MKIHCGDSSDFVVFVFSVLVAVVVVVLLLLQLNSGIGQAFFPTMENIWPRESLLFERGQR